MLNLLHDTTMTKVESNDTKALEKIKELRKIAFDVQAGPQQRSSQEYWKKLGFRDHINPITDFQETPPGMLALELMYRFASSHPENYTRFAVFAGWSDNHEFPFARTSIELVKIICEIVRIGHDPATELEQRLTVRPATTFWRCTKRRGKTPSTEWSYGARRQRKNN